MTGPVEKTGAGTERGIALIMVLWVITVLMAIVLAFSFSTRTTTSSALAFKESTEEKFVAEAGIERGVMEIFYRKQNMNQPAVEGEEGIWRIDGTPNVRTLSGGQAVISLMDEAGKVDINRATDVILKNLFSNLGIQEDQVNTIVDSIMDWKDEDNLHRINGAEDEYYMSLPRPYHAKNGPFDSLEELLLVKGITPELLYGNAQRRGVIDLLTINSGTDKINPNAASKEVLMAVPGMSPDAADSIIAMRKDKEIRAAQDLAVLLGPGYVALSPYFAMSEGNVYSVSSLVTRAGGRGRYAIRAVVALEGNRYKFISYKSPSVVLPGPEAAQ